MPAARLAVDQVLFLADLRDKTFNDCQNIKVSDLRTKARNLGVHLKGNLKKAKIVAMVVAATCDDLRSYSDCATCKQTWKFSLHVRHCSVSPWVGTTYI